MKYSINYGAYGLERQERVLLRLLDVEYILIWKPAWGFEEDHGLRQKKKKKKMVWRQFNLKRNLNFYLAN